MREIIEDALFLGIEEKSFKKEDKTIEFKKISFLDGKNNFVEATLDKEAELPEQLPEAREECVIDFEMEERQGKNGAYIAKRVYGVS